MENQVISTESKGGDKEASLVPSAQPAPETLETSIKAQESEVPLEKVIEIKQENLENPNDTKDAQPENIQLEVEKEMQKEENNKEQVAQSAESVKTEAGPKEEVQTTVEAKVETNGEPDNVIAPKDQGDWEQRESELLKKIDELENIRKERNQESLALQLKVREEEIDLLKARVKNLETELQVALSKPSGKNHEMIEKIKQQHEELLSKARGMIFDKTKMVKNQELQIEALNTQIVSLKDINQITKDLLEIRNSEIKAMEDRLQAMEARFKAEKERYGLVLQRAQTSSNINDDLRKEYETQLALFKQLREKYDQRVQALVAENERLKNLNPATLDRAGPGAGTSG